MPLLPPLCSSSTLPIHSYLLLRATRSQELPFTLPKAAKTFRVSSVSLPSSSSDASDLACSVASSPLAQWRLGRNHHLLLLNATACAVAISASWLFFSAIPAILAFRRAAESVEKLLDSTTDELPETMAAVRLSGMEISDLTMELSDLGQELTKGVRSSTRAVRVAEDRLCQLTTAAPPDLVQKKPTLKGAVEGPVLATAARNLHDGISSSRAAFGAALSIIHFSRWAMNFLAKHGKKRSSYTKNAASS